MNPKDLKFGDLIKVRGNVLKNCECNLFEAKHNHLILMRDRFGNLFAIVLENGNVENSRKDNYFHLKMLINNIVCYRLYAKDSLNSLNSLVFEKVVG